MLERSRQRSLATLLAVFVLGALALFEFRDKADAAHLTYPANTDIEYTACKRVFSDPHAYWPAPTAAPEKSPWAKGNQACAADDFLLYTDGVGRGGMVEGMTYLESLYPELIEFYNLEDDFGDGSDCATSTSPADYCSAGLGRVSAPNGRLRSDLYLVRVTDENVPAANKKFFAFPLSIHGIERAGAEAGVRMAEDLATWAYCESPTTFPTPAVLPDCALEGTPHPLVETQPQNSLTAGAALKQTALYFVFANPDGWRRGDDDNGAQAYQRYNGNGVDMNRDWPTQGFTFRPYTPWSEPETKAFGHVLKQIRQKWAGGIDLHGQLNAPAFSFTMIGASERDYSKDQRVLQVVKGAWEDAEQRLSWSPLIIPNDAPPDPALMYGVQWGTVWDTIAYTTTGSFGDWIDSPIGLDGDGIDNEMSLSHLAPNSAYQQDNEQLHIDGNKSLVYSMVNFSLLPEDTRMEAPGKVAYVFDPTKRENDGQLLQQPPTAGLPAQDDMLDEVLAPPDFTFEFDVEGPNDGVYNGGLEARATPSVPILSVSGQDQTALTLERYRNVTQEDGVAPDEGCTGSGDDWEEVNRFFDQEQLYFAAGQAVHANLPSPGLWRVCVTGDTATQVASANGTFDLDITFTGEQAWEDPGQLAYSVSNMKFFDDLKSNMLPGQLQKVTVNQVLSGAVNLRKYHSVVIADDPFPGFSEAAPTGAAQPDETRANPAATAVTPCAGDDTSEAPCSEDQEFDVLPGFNNQSLTVSLDSPDASVDWDLYIQRQSQISQEWFTVGQGATGSADEATTLLNPPEGHYRARIVNWSGGAPPDQLRIEYDNAYTGPPIEPSTRSLAQRNVWANRLKNFTKAGGNLVLTDGALKNLAYMNVVPRSAVNNFSAYAGYIGFTRDGTNSSYGDPLATNIDQPGAAEGPQFRHQTFEPVPIGFAIQDGDGADYNASPIWAVDQLVWEQRGGRTAGITTGDQVSLGEIPVGNGVVRVIGPLLPMPSEQYYHPFGLANYALTYTGYQVLKNSLQWQKCGGHEKLFGRHLVGTSAANTMKGTTGRDIICGGPGADLLIGLRGNDAIFGGRGRDRIRAGRGRDLVRAGRAGDRLSGGRGRDRLFGGRGPDLIIGGPANDTCRGGKGRDRRQLC